jgi:hypothetical protein
MKTLPRTQLDHAEIPQNGKTIFKMFVVLLWMYIHTAGKLKSLPDHRGIEPATFGMQVTTSYSPEYIG